MLPLWLRVLCYLCADLNDVTLADEETNSILTDNANMAFQGNVAMRVTQPGSQLWNHEYKSDFKTIEKSDFKKVEKSDLKKVEKYKSFSIEIGQSERADLVDMCPDFDFFLKRLDVFMHTLDSKFRYIINTIVIISKMTPFITRQRLRARRLVFSPSKV